MTSKRDIARRIYLTGFASKGYTVIAHVQGHELRLPVPTTAIGNAIVRALRELEATP